MNNRQKAKHFKRLYEEQMKKPVPVVFKTYEPRHYRISRNIDALTLNSFYGVNPPVSCVDMIKDKMIEDIEPKLKDKITYNRDRFTGNYILALDFWV